MRMGIAQWGRESFDKGYGKDSGTLCGFFSSIFLGNSAPWPSSSPGLVALCRHEVVPIVGEDGIGEYLTHLDIHMGCMQGCCRS